MFKAKPLLFLLLFVVLTSCAKPHVIFRDGVEVPVEQAAKADFEKAEGFFGRRFFKNAIPLYQNIVTDMPFSSYADNALLRLAQIQRARKQPANAQKLLETLILRYPTGDSIRAAKEELGKLFYSQKKYPQSVQILSSIDWRKIPVTRRAQLEKITRSAYKQADLEQAMFPWLLNVHNSASEGPDQLQYRAEIVSLLDQSLDERALQRLVRNRRDQFPSGYAHFKLAKLAHHMGNLDEARRWVTSFLNRFPQHEYSREAIVLSETLYYGEEVDPKAIGLLIPLSGNNSVYAEQVLKGVALAIDLFREQSDLDPDINFYIADSGSDPERAAAAVEELVRKRKVIATMGPLFSKQSQAAAVVALEFGLPLITLSAAEGITRIGKGVYRNSLTKSEQAEELARVAIETLKINRAAILYPRSNYGTEFMTFFWKAFETRGGEIRAAESYPVDTGDYSVPLKRLVGLYPLDFRQDDLCDETEMKRRKEDPRATDLPPCYTQEELPPLIDFEALFVPDSYQRAVQIAPALAYYDVRGVQLLGTNLWNTSEIFRGRTARYLQGALFLDSFYKNNKAFPVPQFMESFYTTFGAEPGIFEAQAYDTASMILSVLSDRRPSSRRSFRKGFDRVSNFAGVAGQISVDSNRNAKHKLTTLTIDGTDIVELH